MSEKKPNVMEKTEPGEVADPTWGFNDRTIYVKDGLRAEILVYYRSDGTSGSAATQPPRTPVRNSNEDRPAIVTPVSEDASGKILEPYHVNGSSHHQIGKGWVQFWLDTTGRSLPEYCPCHKPNEFSRDKPVQHKLAGSTAGAHVIFRTADGQLKVAIVPVCRSCNSGEFPINFECKAVTIFDVGAQTYVGEIKGKSQDDQGGEHSTQLNKFDKLEVSLKDENLSLLVAGTGPMYGGKTPHTEIKRDVSRKEDDLYYASIALTAMGGLAKNHQRLTREHPNHVPTIHTLNKGLKGVSAGPADNGGGHEESKASG